MEEIAASFASQDNMEEGPPAATRASRPSLSIDLPSFEFHGQTTPIPRTPEQLGESTIDCDPPPPPRAQPFKLKRRRAAPTLPPSDALLPEEPPLVPMFQAAIPTIEMSEAGNEPFGADVLDSASSDGLLMPLPAPKRVGTPRTPAPREEFASPVSPVHEWALINDSCDNNRTGLHRAGSVCSSFSDSSVSSAGSSAFSAPNNGSCTSPESVATDPFAEDDIKGDHFTLSPPQSDHSSPTAKRVKRHRHVKWVPEMDQHLENTYIQYLRDPRVTPFKTLPGIPPPLGVCSRVASKARRTWSQHRITTPTISSLDAILESVPFNREGSPDTIRPGPSMERHHRQQWPSDAATRKRLRKLVKSKPQLSAHYQRLLRTRTPSPFTSSSAPSRSSEPPSATAFSSRDMKVSLVTATAPSMQPEGPLAQLSSDDAPQTNLRPQSRSSRPADWFARIGRSQAHQKSFSLQSSFSFDGEASQPQQPLFLASPFDDDSNRTHLLQSMSGTKSLGRSDFTGKGKDRKPPSLDSPIEFTSALTAPRSLKRRFKSDEEKPRRPILADIFGPPTPDAGIVRNRGFTVGAARASDNLAKIFEPAEPPPPPPPIPACSFGDQEMTEAPSEPDYSSLGPIGSRSAPRRLAEPVPRLGSPFLETPVAGRTFNTFPRSFIPTPSNPCPFGDRLRELARSHQQT